MSLLNKLGSQFYNMEPFGPDLKSLDPELIRTITVDKTWFLSQVKQRYVYISRKSSSFLHVSFILASSIRTGSPFIVSTLKSLCKLRKSSSRGFNKMKFTKKQFKKLEFRLLLYGREVPYNLLIRCAYNTKYQSPDLLCVYLAFLLV